MLTAKRIRLEALTPEKELKGAREDIRQETTGEQDVNSTTQETTEEQELNSTTQEATGEQELKRTGRGTGEEQKRKRARGKQQKTELRNAQETAGAEQWPKSEKKKQ